MKSLWDDKEAQAYGDDALQLRVYTSRLLGREPALVMHGGGNTSVKASTSTIFGETVDVLYVKGSGWDLATIEAEGFAPVRMDVLTKLARMENLSDSVIVHEQRAALINPTAPNPSVEAILHAIIPFTFVDHTHADAVVTLTNTPEGERMIREVYGDRVLIVPYVMPGFTLARTVFEMTQDVDWGVMDAIILMNHGVFTFGATARESYEQMIAIVSSAEEFLAHGGALAAPAKASAPQHDWLKLSRLRKAVSTYAGKAMLAQLNDTPEAVGFASLPNVADIATRGPITPDHVIRTKAVPVVIHDMVDDALQLFTQEYEAYFARNRQPQHTMLDPAPRWAVWQGRGLVTFGETVNAANITRDISEHTIQAIQWAEHLGGWHPLPESDLFEVEYWELEQAKLQRAGAPPTFQGKVAIVTGAASGIGLACALELERQGAAVVGLDINPSITDTLNRPTARGLVCDLTDAEAIANAVEYTVRNFGGIDILVSNAGIFPSSQTIAEMQADLWSKSLAVNLTSHQLVLQACIPYLEHGIDPAVVMVGSKNYPAPGRGASAYSVTKAGSTQLARVAALELAPHGIRVNVVHPDAVFDTGIWSDEVIAQRAKNYGLTPEEYMSKNLLHTQITSADVAKAVCALASPLFGKTTGAQIPIDGGNERVI